MIELETIKKTGSNNFQIPETKKLIEELTYMRTNIYPGSHFILIEELSKVIINLGCNWNCASNTLTVKVDPKFIQERNIMHDITTYYPMIYQIMVGFLFRVKSSFDGIATAGFSGESIPMFIDIVDNPLKIVSSVSAILSDTLIICL